ncbi:MAG: hypothetical protein IJ994_00640 [Firmicutes bacterium]|nr:hypothetical protein [Bacillota bacterium]
MIQLNKQFRMDGREILTPRDFCHYYSPTDLLRHRKMASGFVRYQMAGLSPWHDYHAEIFYKAVFQWNKFEEEKAVFNAVRGLSEVEPVDMAEFYLDVPGIWRHVNTSRWISTEYTQLEKIMHNTYGEQYRKALSSIWKSVQETDLTQEEREQVFMILSAGYFLSRTRLNDLEECTVSAKEIQLAFRGESAEEITGPEPTKDGFVIKASKVPYELPKSSVTSTGFILYTVEIKKITAVQSADGSTTIPVKLNLDGETVEIMPGDYRYGSCVNGEWIRIFPVRKEHDGVIMERKGNTIIVTAKDQVTQIDCSKREILDFDVDSQGNYIILEPKYADYSHYSQKTGVLSQLPSRNIIEVSIRNDQVYLLDTKGSVFKNGVQQGSYPTSLIYRP